MNNTPPSADLNKLKNILGNAKALIKMDSPAPNRSANQPLPSPRQQQQQPVERDGYGPTQNIQYLSEADMLKSQGKHEIQHSMGDPTRKPGHISEESIRNSNLPESIKQAYLNNPIPQPTSINHTFDLNDMSDLIENNPIPQSRGQQINENVIHNNDKFTVSETALRGIIKDVLVEYLAADYSKNLTEATIKKTITTLIKEGKIRTKTK